MLYIEKIDNIQHCQKIYMYNLFVRALETGRKASL